MKTCSVRIIKVGAPEENAYLGGDTSLAQLQGWVGGYIERVPLSLFNSNLKSDTDIYVDEDGLLKSLEPNHTAMESLGWNQPYPLVGPVVVVTWSRGAKRE